MPPPPRISRSSSAISGRTSSRERSRTGMLFSTLCRAAVSLASREKTVISQGTAARSCATMDWRIASSPRLSPPYDPEMPIRYTWSAASLAMGPFASTPVPAKTRAISHVFPSPFGPVGRNFPIGSGRNFPSRSHVGASRHPRPRHGPGTSLALLVTHDHDDAAPMDRTGRRPRRPRGSRLRDRALLHRRAAAPLHRGEDERAPQGLHRLDRHPALQSDQLLARSAGHRDRSERASRPAGREHRAALRERALAGAPVREGGRG